MRARNGAPGLVFLVKEKLPSIDMRFRPLIVLVLSAASCFAQKIAITFDDLPLNGTLPPGVTRAEIARGAIAILKKHHAPPAYGFINAKKLEGDADAAEALKIWAAAEPVGNHTYSHLDLNDNPPEGFEREVEQNEPALELLAEPGANWRWLRYPYLREGDTLEKRRAVRAYLAAHGYKTAQVTMDWEDYMWNSAYARCSAKNDAESIAWLKSSYLEYEDSYLDLGRELARLTLGHDINHVLLLHLGAFTSTILPDALDHLKKKGFHLVTLEEAQSDPAYSTDPDVASKYGGTLLEQWMEARQIKFPPAKEKPYQRMKEICQ
jgi:peptidoglycan/xylan/chitin deacetylase (PgdA/CDA1 family)